VLVLVGLVLVQLGLGLALGLGQPVWGWREAPQPVPPAVTLPSEVLHRTEGTSRRAHCAADRSHRKGAPTGGIGGLAASDCVRSGRSLRREAAVG